MTRQCEHANGCGDDLCPHREPHEQFTIRNINLCSHNDCGFSCQPVCQHMTLLITGAQWCAVKQSNPNNMCKSCEVKA